MNKVTTPSTWAELNNIINSEPTDTYIALDELQDYIDSGELSYFDGLMAHGKAISSDTSLGVKTQNCVVGTDAELDKNNIHLTDMVGVGGWTNYEAILMAIMNAVGIKVKDVNVGDNIHDAFETVDQEYLDKYISMLKDVHSGDKYILYYNDKTYIRLQAFGMLVNEFINDGIFETAGVTYYNFTQGSNTITNLFDYNVLFNEANKLATAEKFKPNYILNKAKSQGYDVPEITPNDLVIWVQALGTYYSGHVYITKNVLNNTYDTSTTNMPNSQFLHIPYNDFIYHIGIDTDEIITYEHLTNPTGNVYDIIYSVPRYSLWNLGTTIQQVQGIELMSDAVKLETGWDIATDFPTWESDKLLLHGYINKQLYELEHYPIRYDATKIVSDTLANAQDGVSDYDKIAIDKGKDDAKEQGAVIPTEPTTPTTPTPIILPPSTDVIGMYRIYNPTPSQLQSITNFLWGKSEGEGGSFFDNVTKLFQDPMQCIIGLSRVYAPVSVGGTEQFTIGKVTVPTSWLSLPVNTTSSQYSEVDMGSVSIKEYFGDVRDYDGYTQIQIYLPFIGFRQLKTNDVMGGTIHLTYYVDILTGNCNAKIDVSRKNMVRQCLYTFDGNCSEQIPVSGSNYTNLISSTLMGMISGAGTGGQIGAVVGGATSLMSGMSNNVQRSGSISGSLGAINIKKPYLIISRPIPADANTFNNFYGYPANKTIRLGNCSGYTKIKSVHVEGIICTDEEKNMIETLLKQGVIV